MLPVRAMWAKTALVTGLRLRKRQLAVAGTTATVLTIADKYPMSFRALHGATTQLLVCEPVGLSLAGLCLALHLKFVGLCAPSLHMA